MVPGAANRQGQATTAFMAVTAYMIADGLTKPLYRQKHTTFVEQLGLQMLLN